MTRLDRLVELAKELGDIEMDVLVELAERIFRGQNTYGLFLLADKRDFRREAEEEALDMAVYCARRLHQKRTPNSGQTSPTAHACGESALGSAAASTTNSPVPGCAESAGSATELNRKR